MDKRQKISIIVPCYNEMESLPIFYKEITAILEKINYDYEILFVNDGSKDNTLNILKEFSKIYE